MRRDCSYGVVFLKNIKLFAKLLNNKQPHLLEERREMINDNIIGSVADMADDVMLLPMVTVERLFQADNPVECFALYGFYYKTYKWQKNTKVFANDDYVKKSLKWGAKKVSDTKKELKKMGLISLVAERNDDGSISKWYVKLEYLVKFDIQGLSNESCGVQGLSKTTSCSQATNTINNNKDTINNNIYLKKEKNTKKKNKTGLENAFDLWYANYPNKKSKEKAKNIFIKLLQTNQVTLDALCLGLDNYNKHIQANQIQKEFTKHPSTWLNQGCWEDEYDSDQNKQPSKYPANNIQSKAENLPVQSDISILGTDIAPEIKEEVLRRFNGLLSNFNQVNKIQVDMLDENSAKYQESLGYFYQIWKEWDNFPRYRRETNNPTFKSAVYPLFREFVNCFKNYMLNRGVTNLTPNCIKTNGGWFTGFVANAKANQLNDNEWAEGISRVMLTEEADLRIQKVHNELGVFSDELKKWVK